MTSIVANCGQRSGEIRPMHGVNNGPICYGGVLDQSDYYAELDVPCTRVYAPDWNGWSVLDIPQIFPNFRADPDNPANYKFGRIDDYLASIVPLTKRLICNLGTSIEHTARKYNTHPPADFDQWARICVGLIRHLNCGWGDGHRFGIRDFEIWNEPDEYHPVQWNGSFAQYLELYKVASRAIKGFDSSLRVGGPALAAVDRSLDRAEEFLAYVRAEQLPLDFFSWHLYATSPAELQQQGRKFRALLDESGFEDTENLLTEWNDWDLIPPLFSYIAKAHDTPATVATPHTYETQAAARDVYRRNKGSYGGAFAAAGLIALQDAGVDEATYYEATHSWFGLFDNYGLPAAAFYSFRAFRRLLEVPQRVVVTGGDLESGVLALAGLSADAASGALLASNLRGSDDLSIEIIDNPGEGPVEVTVSMIDDEHKLEVVDRFRASGAFTWNCTQRAPYTVLLQFDRRRSASASGESI